MRTSARLACALAASSLLVSCAAPNRPGANPHPAASPTSNVSRAITDKPTTSSAAAGVDNGQIRPVRLRIPAIGVDKQLEKLGVTPRGRL